MRTDWALVRRLAFELDERLRGARVQDAGALDDGRLALQLWTPGSVCLCCIDVFGSPPAVTLAAGALSVASEPGFARTMARTLRGTRLGSVEARARDRLLKLTFRTRSRFGVDDEVDLYIELVPRFGNAVLVKGSAIVDALQEFDPAHSARATLAGMRYVPPPLPAEPLPSLAAESGMNPAQALEMLESESVLREPLYVYRSDGRFVQAHLLPLPQLAPATLSRESSLLDLLTEDRVQRRGADASVRQGQRRAALERRIVRRMRRLDTAVAALASRERESEGREALRKEGDAIFATLHELDAPAQREAKERATKIFARYRKLIAAMPHIEQRRSELALQREALETLLWEAQRGDDTALAEIAQALDTMERKRSGSPVAKRKRRAPLELRTPNGSRILVGRSPSENAELTFRVARPNDLWFHARGVPGAHVILTRDDRSAPPDEDIELAASLAAGHSKARDSAKVTIDYAQRKHVRKRPEAPPGLVFYTQAKSVTVTPKRD